MKRRLFIAAAVASIMFVPVSALAADATLTLKATSVATGVGHTGGSGVLNYKGHDIPFKLSGFAFGEVGISTLKATGTVSNLSFPEKFNGIYDTQKLDGTVVVGKGISKMKNDSGVVIELKSEEMGLKLGAALGGARMTLDPDALAKALAALNAPKIKAVYNTSVYFDLGKSAVRESEDASVNQVISYLEKNPSSEVILAGYADTTGSEKGNQKLSEKRADKVFEVLKRRAQGTNITQLPPKRIEIIGRGQVDGPAGVANQADRRVDVLVITTGRASM